MQSTGLLCQPSRVQEGLEDERVVVLRVRAVVLLPGRGRGTNVLSGGVRSEVVRSEVRRLTQSVVSKLVRGLALPSR